MSDQLELRGAARQVRRMARGVMEGRVAAGDYRSFRADLIDELLETGRSPQEPLSRRLAGRFRPADARGPGVLPGGDPGGDPALAATLPGTLAPTERSAGSGPGLRSRTGDVSAGAVRTGEASGDGGTRVLAAGSRTRPEDRGQGEVPPVEEPVAPRARGRRGRRLLLLALAGLAALAVGLLVLVPSP